MKIPLIAGNPLRLINYNISKNTKCECQKIINKRVVNTFGGQSAAKLLSNMEILYEERSSTIPQGSRAKWLEIGNTLL